MNCPVYVNNVQILGNNESYEERLDFVCANGISAG